MLKELWGVQITIMVTNVLRDGIKTWFLRLWSFCGCSLLSGISCHWSLSLSADFVCHSVKIASIEVQSCLILLNPFKQCPFLYNLIQIFPNPSKIVQSCQIMFNIVKLCWYYSCPDLLFILFSPIQSFNWIIILGLC